MTKQRALHLSLASQGLRLRIPLGASILPRKHPTTKAQRILNPLKFGLKPKVEFISYNWREVIWSLYSVSSISYIDTLIYSYQQLWDPPPYRKKTYVKVSVRQKGNNQGIQTCRLPAYGSQKSDQTANIFPCRRLLSSMRIWPVIQNDSLELGRLSAKQLYYLNGCSRVQSAVLSKMIIVLLILLSVGFDFRSNTPSSRLQMPSQEER